MDFFYIFLIFAFGHRADQKRKNHRHSSMLWCRISCVGDGFRKWYFEGERFPPPRAPLLGKRGKSRQAPLSRYS